MTSSIIQIEDYKTQKLNIILDKSWRFRVNTIYILPNVIEIPDRRTAEEILDELADASIEVLSFNIISYNSHFLKMISKSDKLKQLEKVTEILAKIRRIQN